MAWNLEALGAFAGMADMQMAGENQIDTAPRKACHGHVRASDQTVKLVGFGQIKGVMGHDDARAIFPARFQPRATPGHLPRVDAAILERERARGINAYDRDFVIVLKRFEVLADVALVVPERFHGAGVHVVQRHIMIAGNNNLRRRKSVQKSPRFLKFAFFGALRKIAGNHHNVGPRFGDRGNQCLHDGGIDAAEVRIR
jgi:hypothetical protein